MAMNRKGQMIILKMMIAVVLLIFVLGWVIPIKEAITSAGNTTSLNCSSSTLDYQQVATCTVLDFTLFYYLGALISVGMAFLAGKKNGLGVITGITSFVIVIVMISPLKQIIVLIRDVDHLSCASATISVASKMSCLLVDLWLFWFIAIILSAIVSYFFTKEVKRIE